MASLYYDQYTLFISVACIPIHTQNDQLGERNSEKRLKVCFVKKFLSRC